MSAQEAHCDLGTMDINELCAPVPGPLLAMARYMTSRLALWLTPLLLLGLQACAAEEGPLSAGAGDKSDSTATVWDCPAMCVDSTGGEPFTITIEVCGDLSRGDAIAEANDEGRSECGALDTRFIGVNCAPGGADTSGVCPEPLPPVTPSKYQETIDAARASIRSKIEAPVTLVAVDFDGPSFEPVNVFFHTNANDSCIWQYSVASTESSSIDGLHVVSSDVDYQCSDPVPPAGSDVPRCDSGDKALELQELGATLESPLRFEDGAWWGRDVEGGLVVANDDC